MKEKLVLCERCIDPRTMKQLRRSRSTTATVDADHTVVVNGQRFKFADDVDVDVGDDVEVVLRRGELYARVDDGEQDADESDEAASSTPTSASPDDRKQDAQAEAAAFWAQYDLPFDPETGMNKVRSGLLRGSDGTGADRQTVVHLVVTDDFTEGRLERTAGDFLCHGAGKMPETGTRHVTSDGEQYMPAVTCNSCLDYMERWKTDSDD